MKDDDQSDLTPERLGEALSALEEQLGSAGSSFELIVIGGSALQALGLIDRATRDVDVVALGAGPDLSSADPLPEALVRAATRVARDFGLHPHGSTQAPRIYSDWDSLQVSTKDA